MELHDFSSSVYEENIKHYAAFIDNLKLYQYRILELFGFFRKNSQGFFLSL